MHGNPCQKATLQKNKKVVHYDVTPAKNRQWKQNFKVCLVFLTWLDLTWLLFLLFMVFFTFTYNAVPRPPASSPSPWMRPEASRTSTITTAIMTVSCCLTIIMRMMASFWEITRWFIMKGYTVTIFSQLEFFSSFLSNGGELLMRMRIGSGLNFINGSGPEIKNSTQL